MYLISIEIIQRLLINNSHSTRLINSSGKWHYCSREPSNGAISMFPVESSIIANIYDIFLRENDDFAIVILFEGTPNVLKKKNANQ